MDFRVFKVPWELWNPLCKAVPGKFNGSGGYSKCNCLQDQANFHRSWAWQIVLIFYTEIIYLRPNLRLNCVNSLWLSDCYMTSWKLVNIGSGNGLLLSGTKPLTEPMLNSGLRDFLIHVFIRGHLRKKYSKYQSLWWIYRALAVTLDIL